MYPQAGRCLDLGSFNTWQAAIPAAPQTPSCAWLVGAPVLASSVLIPVTLGDLPLRPPETALRFYFTVHFLIFFHRIWNSGSPSLPEPSFCGVVKDARGGSEEGILGTGKQRGSPSGGP